MIDTNSAHFSLQSCSSRINCNIILHTIGFNAEFFSNPYPKGHIMCLRLMYQKTIFLNKCIICIINNSYTHSSYSLFYFYLCHIVSIFVFDGKLIKTVLWLLTFFILYIKQENWKNVKNIILNNAVKFLINLLTREIVINQNNWMTIENN